MRCRECEACKAEPFMDEFSTGEEWGFTCADAKDRWIGGGIDEDHALPKTSRRWCPRRKKTGEPK